ncbi:MAG: diacylglycerol kinase family protein [Crocinitomicaceae bacterium]
MNRKKNILFIINPISGIGKKDILPKLIKGGIDHDKFSYLIKYTKHKKHGAEIAISEKKDYDAIIAIGGDGTVNEIGTALLLSNCALGIIPTGSGNGIARHLKISRNLKKALEQINRFKIETIDTGTCNGKAFIGVCGFGFDAYIAEAFENYHKRGMRSYAKLIRKLYKKYTPPVFSIHGKSFSINKQALLACVSNSSEYGNGFAISPYSEMQDGRFEMILIDKFSLLSVPIMLTRFFTKKIDKSKHHTAINFDSNIRLVVNGDAPVSYHLDGEHMRSESNEFKISVKPKSLRVLV